jgi:hypothetical protein
MTTMRMLLGVALLAAGGCASHRHPARDILAAPEGVYHAENQVDALNVQLNPDGTFHATFCGCDYDGAAAGRWRRDGDGIVLLPPPGAETFFWIGVGRVGELRGRLTPQTILVGEGGAAEPWAPGRVCPVCGGSLGPTGQRSCPEPLPKECGGQQEE